MDKSPMTPINEIVADSTQEYLEQQWITLVDTDKYHLNIDQYLEIGDKFGPDITAIPRYRFDPKLFRKSLTAQTPKRQTSYEIYRKSVKGQLSNQEIIQRWKDMPIEEKEKYKPINQEKS